MQTMALINILKDSAIACFAITSQQVQFISIYTLKTVIKRMTCFLE